MLTLSAVQVLRAVKSTHIKFIWLLAAALVLILALRVSAGLFRKWSQQAALNAISPVDPEKKDRMMEICLFPQTLQTKDELALVYEPGSDASRTPSHKRHVPVLQEPYPSLVEVEAAIGKADLTDGGWMEWKENPTDPANTNWYLRIAFDSDKKLKEFATRTSSKGPDGCKEVRIGRAAGDWSQSFRNNAACGLDCR